MTTENAFLENCTSPYFALACWSSFVSLLVAQMCYNNGTPSVHPGMATAGVLAKREEYGRRHVCPWPGAAAAAPRRRPAAAVGDRATNQRAPHLRRLVGRGRPDRGARRRDGTSRIFTGDDQARQRQHGHPLGGRNGQSD